MVNDLERRIIELVATDRMYVPSSSFDGKLERKRPKIAKSIVPSLDGPDFEGNRAYAKLVNEDKDKARGMRSGIEEFSNKFPKYGEILQGIIQEKRIISEKHLYFGMQDGKRLTKDDYVGVLTDMGLGPTTAEKYCDVALDISRNLNQKRGYEERRVLVG